MSENKKYGNRNKKLDEKSLEIKLLAKRLKQLRINAGYTSAEIFSYDTGISRSQYSRYERGEDIRFSTIIRLCKLYGIELKDFLSEGFEELKQ